MLVIMRLLQIIVLLLLNISLVVLVHQLLSSSNTNNLIITDTGVPTPGKRAKLGPAILNDNGEIIKIDVLDGGYGYSAPTLYIKNDTSINNTAFLLPKLKYAYDGGIANINIINEGSGYINTDVENTFDIKLIDSSNNTVFLTARLKAILGSSPEDADKIVEFEIIDNGSSTNSSVESGFPSNISYDLSAIPTPSNAGSPVIIDVELSGSIDYIEVVNGGRNYQQLDSLTVTNSIRNGGQGAEVIATLSGGIITDLNFSNSYQGTGAEITPVFSDNNNNTTSSVIIDINVTNEGSGYYGGAFLTDSNNDIVNGAVVICENGKVKSVDITNASTITGTPRIRSAYGYGYVEPSNAALNFTTAGTSKIWYITTIPSRPKKVPFALFHKNAGNVNFRADQLYLMEVLENRRFLMKTKDYGILIGNNFFKNSLPYTSDDIAFYEEMDNFKINIDVKDFVTDQFLYYSNLGMINTNNANMSYRRLPRIKTNRNIELWKGDKLWDNTDGDYYQFNSLTSNQQIPSITISNNNSLWANNPTNSENSGQGEIYRENSSSLIIINNVPFNYDLTADPSNIRLSQNYPDSFNYLSYSFLDIKNNESIGGESENHSRYIFNKCKLNNYCPLKDLTLSGGQVFPDTSQTSYAWAFPNPNNNVGFWGAVALTYPDSYKITIPPASSIDGKDNRFDFYLRTTFFHNCWKQANIMPIVAANTKYILNYKEGVNAAPFLYNNSIHTSATNGYGWWLQ